MTLKLKLNKRKRENNAASKDAQLCSAHVASSGRETEEKG